MLSHISNRPRVAYLVLVTLISHGWRCGTDFSDSELRDHSISYALVCEKELSHMGNNNGNPDLVFENLDEHCIHT